ncbi:MFS transporter [Bifidobacterium sp. W8106]|uniref:MFS transporter n=1 Tax=Bifidobacterium TaxID=1678 RepID=UPI0018DD0B51|nr:MULTISPECIES: MFS transporter [Bifidobacterium]MBI0142709.1 MFS transporter [Bifidobacterium choladohabitans]MBI0147856.1 MFS transporter [Bifidobacterium sp. W8104]
MQELLKNKPFVTMVLASLLNTVGGELFNIVFIVYAQTMPFAGLAVSIASMAWVAPALTAILTGYLADRTVHKTRMQLVIKLIQVCVYLVMAMTIGRSKSLPVFLLLVAMDMASSMLEGYAGSLWMPVLKHLVLPGQLHQATSITSAASSVAAVISAGGGAVLIALLGNRFAVFALINAATFLLAGILVAIGYREFTRVEVASNGSPADKPSGLASSLRVTLGEFHSSTFLILIVGFGCLVNLLGTALQPLLNLGLISMPGVWWGSYGTTIAVVNGIYSLGLILGALLAADPLRRLPIAHLLTGVMAAAAMVGINLVWLHMPTLLFLPLLVMNYLLGKINPRFMTMLISTVGEDHLAATMGVVQTVMMIGAPLGQMVFLTLGNLVGIAITMSIYASLTGLLALVIFITGLLGMNAKDPTPEMGRRLKSG